MRADPGVRVVDTFPAHSHPPIRYPLALTRTAAPGSARFLDFLRSDAAGGIGGLGFAVLR